MGIPVIQVPSLILPQYWLTGLEHEDVADLLCHISSEFYIADIEEKQAHVIAVENVAAGMPGNLLCWVELSPVDSPVSFAYWAAIGGGGGVNPVTLLPYIAPIAPVVEVATGVNGTPHNIILPWVLHSAYARIVVQTPIAAALPGAFWQVQVIISGKTA